MNKMEDKIDLILSEIKNLNERITTMEGNMTTKQELENLTTKIDTVTHQVASNSEKLDVITEEQNQIKQATMDTKEDATSLKDGQERQDKILESLSLRSLEQETDIRDLKRIK